MKSAHSLMQNKRTVMESYTIKCGHYIMQSTYHIVKITRHTMESVHSIMARVYLMKRYIKDTRYIIKNIATPYDGSANQIRQSSTA